MEYWQERLVALIDRKGWSRRVLSQRSGISTSTIDKWLTGPKEKRPKWVTMPTAIMLCKSLQVPLDVLFNPDPDWMQSGSDSKMVLNLTDPSLQEMVGGDLYVKIPQALRPLAEPPQPKNQRAEKHIDPEQ